MTSTPRGHLPEAAYVDANVSLDKELHALKLKKAEFVQGLPLLHKESVELSIRQFCEIALARFEHCTVFDDKRQFLVEHVESIIYDRYRLTVIGSVPIKMQLSNSQEIETRKLAFCLRGEIDKTTLHKKPRKTFAEARRLPFLNRNGSRSYGANGRVMNGAHRSLTSGVRPPAARQSRRNSKDFLGFRSCVLRST